MFHLQEAQNVLGKFPDWTAFRGPTELGSSLDLSAPLLRRDLLAQSNLHNMPSIYLLGDVLAIMVLWGLTGCTAKLGVAW